MYVNKTGKPKKFTQEVFLMDTQVIRVNKALAQKLKNKFPDWSYNKILTVLLVSYGELEPEFIQEYGLEKFRAYIDSKIYPLYDRLARIEEDIGELFKQ